MWDTKNLNLLSHIRKLPGKSSGIPHLAKDERVMGHPSFCWLKGTVLPPILNAQGISKSFGADPLLRNVAFTVEERARIGLIGPNGSGKSTLLGILAGQIDPDSGEVVARKRTRLSYVAQQSEFAPGTTVLAVLEAALARAGVLSQEWAGRVAELSGRVGFADLSADASRLSGGWRKRLAIAESLVQEPDVLLLDEPTNHLDLEGITW